jgi:surfeit locus 1 family protein
MLLRFRRARLLLPTVVALAGLAILIGLGTWQLERKRWKEGLLAKVAARVDSAPVSLSEAERRMRAGEDIEYLHVSAVGRFQHGKERYLYAPVPGGLAWHVYTPLETAEGRIVWINRGAVPDAMKEPAKRGAGQLPGVQTVAGLVRVQQGRARFAPENNAAGNVWYWPELGAMTASAFPQSVSSLPLAIEADAHPEPPGGLPRGGVTRVALPNRHLEYALTWYGLALALVAVFSTFVFNRLRAI